MQDQYAVSEAKQASFLRQSVEVFRRDYPRVQRLIWFLIKDEPTTSPDGRQNTWQSGFRRINGREEARLRRLAAPHGRGAPLAATTSM